MKGKVTFAEVGELFLVSVYIVAAFNAIIDVRDFAFGGKYLYILIFAGAWITDIFAYFSGVLFGKHKLIPEVSPKKTIEGSIGGTLFCVISFIVFGLIVDGFFSMNANFIFLAISGLVVSILAQIGDLIMSVIKRQYGVKDYGKIFPGHGGVLDRFDSILATSLTMCAICMAAELFGIHLI
jgi:phosphatidate cytidylyltransferase